MHGGGDEGVDDNGGVVVMVTIIFLLVKYTKWLILKVSLFCSFSIPCIPSFPVFPPNHLFVSHNTPSVTKLCYLDCFLALCSQTMLAKFVS